MRAFNVRVTTKQRQGSLDVIKNTSWTEVFANGRPKEIKVNIQTEGKNGIAPIIIRGETHESEKSSIEFTLPVQVQWVDGVPRTRCPGKDNCDVILVDSNLRFTDVQVGLISRRGRFFLTGQKIFEGWIRDTGERIEFIPSAPEFAYPGMDYRQTWTNMGEILGIMGSLVSDLGRTSLDIPEPAAWKPFSGPAPTNWQVGTVLYFNAISGTGMILDEDQTRYFVHHSKIILNGDPPVKMLKPMTGVYFRPAKEENTRGPSVRSCKPA